MTDKIERFSPVTRKLLWHTQRLTDELDYHLITVEILLLAMAVYENTDAFIVLEKQGVIESKLLPFLKRSIFPELDPIYKRKYPLYPEQDLSHDIKEILRLGVESARRQELPLIGTASLLIGMMQLESENIDKVLSYFDVKRKEMIQKAEEYARKDDTLERKVWQEILALARLKSDNSPEDESNTLTPLMNMFGLVDNKDDAE